MNFELIKASRDLKQVIQNLMQFYYYDFSEFLKFDIMETGLFDAYPYLDAYWENENERFPYLIKVDGNYAGFVLVKKEENGGRDSFSIGEFFILRKYRLGGLGKAVALAIFNLYRGKWEVYQKETNKPAQVFWEKTISEYTQGRFSKRIEKDKVIQNFEND